MLKSLDGQLETVINLVAIVLALFLVWLFVAQVVIFSQGLELYHGTATRMAGSAVEVAAAPELADKDAEKAE